MAQFKAILVAAAGNTEVNDVESYLLYASVNGLTLDLYTVSRGFTPDQYKVTNFYQIREFKGNIEIQASFIEKQN